MSKYTQKEQTEIVKSALELTATMWGEFEEYTKLESAEFKSKPEKPQYKIFNAEPVPQPQLPTLKYKLNPVIKAAVWVIMLFGLVFWMSMFAVIVSSASGFAPFCITPFVLIGILVAVKEYKKSKQIQLEQDYLHSAEWATIQQNYQQRCIDSVEAAKKAQADFDEHYNAALKDYNDVLLPEWEAAHRVWEEERLAKMQWLRHDLDANGEALDALYDETKLISKAYREISILQWLYDDMSSSDHDIRYATELLDRDRQRAVSESVGKLVAQTTRECLSYIHDDLLAIESGVSSNQAALIDIASETSKLRKRANVLIGLQTAEVAQNRKLRKQLTEG